MPRIKDESVERVKAAMEIVAARRGDACGCARRAARTRGCVPFHQERTPSFTVSPARGTFKCFGCGEGGDAITFVMKRTASTSSTRSRCSRGGSTSSSSTRRARPSTSEARARRAAARAARARRRVLRARALGPATSARPRASTSPSRGLGEEVCREFRLGYAPGGGQLTGRARQEGYSQEELLAVGLANRRGNDYFQRRIVFPLADARGRVRGFQARKLHDDDPLQAKYVNSPEGELFRKGDLLYGLDLLARRSRRRTAPSSSRETPTSSRCGRRGSRRSSRRWGRR